MVSDATKADTDGNSKAIGDMLRIKLDYNKVTQDRVLTAQIAGNKSLFINETVTTLNTVS